LNLRPLGYEDREARFNPVRQPPALIVRGSQASSRDGCHTSTYPLPAMAVLPAAPSHADAPPPRHASPPETGNAFTRRFKRLAAAAGLPEIDLESRPGARFRCCRRAPARALKARGRRWSRASGARSAPPCRQRALSPREVVAYVASGRLHLPRARQAAGQDHEGAPVLTVGRWRPDA
jgi:hypothetical protein